MIQCETGVIRESLYLRSIRKTKNLHPLRSISRTFEGVIGERENQLNCIRVVLAFSLTRKNKQTWPWSATDVATERDSGGGSCATENHRLRQGNNRAKSHKVEQSSHIAQTDRAMTIDELLKAVK